jgi:hypothetical protein
MVEYKDVLNLGYYEYGEAFTGSYKGLRYRIAVEPQKNYRWIPPEKREEHTLRLFTWFGENAFDKTPEDMIDIKDYEYSEEGLKSIVDDINKKLNLSK